MVNWLTYPGITMVFAFVPPPAGLVRFLGPDRRTRGLLFFVPDDKLESIGRFVFGVAYVVTGARLEKDLLDGGRATRTVLKAALAAIVADMAILTGTIGFEAIEPEIGRTIVSVAITLYLLHSVSRLSNEAKAKAGVPPEPPQARALS